MTLPKSTVVTLYDISRSSNIEHSEYIGRFERTEAEKLAAAFGQSLEPAKPPTGLIARRSTSSEDNRPSLRINAVQCVIVNDKAYEIDERNARSISPSAKEAVKALVPQGLIALLTEGTNSHAHTGNPMSKEQHPGSLWIQAHSAELPVNEWVAANKDGLVAHDPNPEVLNQKVAERGIALADVTMSFIQEPGPALVRQTNRNTITEADANEIFERFQQQYFTGENETNIARMSLRPSTDKFIIVIGALQPEKLTGIPNRFEGLDIEIETSEQLRPFSK